MQNESDLNTKEAITYKGQQQGSEIIYNVYLSLSQQPLRTFGFEYAEALQNYHEELC
jgi:hypothetical protein